tara:strand:- start:295 stop:822 length:528 start_codon:yes stop_codon:yes gene_type:complete
MARKPGKTYRTSSGKTVDFGALLLANETAPAIGNMNVNARGDEIDPAGNITKSREQIMREYNELNTMVPTDDSIPEGSGITADDDWKDWEPPKTTPASEQIKETEPVKQKQDESKPKTVAKMVEENPDKVIDKTTEVKKPTGGLAAAVAAAKEVEDNVKESPQQKELNTPGVRRI